MMLRHLLKTMIPNTGKAVAFCGEIVPDGDYTTELIGQTTCLTCLGVRKTERKEDQVIERLDQKLEEKIRDIKPPRVSEMNICSCGRILSYRGQIVCSTCREQYDMKDPVSILQEAERLVGKDKREDYGPVRESFESIAYLWSEIVGEKITPEQVGLMMILFKVARENNRHKRDNLVDICGYAECLSQLSQKTEPAKVILDGMAT